MCESLLTDVMSVEDYKTVNKDCSTGFRFRLKAVPASQRGLFEKIFASASTAYPSFPEGSLLE